MDTVSILIADDHPVVRRGLRALLETRPGWKIVSEESNGRDAVDKVTKLRPDVAILDISMPDLNGLDAAALILKARPETRVLILTMHSAEELIKKTLAAGARGYVLKSDAERDLITAVDALLHGRTFFTSAISGVILDNLRGETTHTGAERKHGDRLSPREREIVQLLAEGRSNKEVAAVLDISTRTVENHRAKVMEKLKLHSLSDLVRYAIRNNIVEA
ncbi:MAG: response regulator transcription factor [Acidobacteriia bacterium]|nr:response regulator transcription factor [Terriglobia bacterium]